MAETTARKAPARTRKANAPDMSNAPEPQDHKTPAEKEAKSEDGMTTLDFHGQKFTVPSDQDDWPILAVQAMSKSMHIDGMQHLLGPVQWQKFVTLFPTRRQFNEFSKALAAELGFETLGN